MTSLPNECQTATNPGETAARIILRKFDIFVWMVFGFIYWVFSVLSVILFKIKCNYFQFSYLYPLAIDIYMETYCGQHIFL